MKTELQYLVYVTVFTGLLWVPYILDRIATRGLHDAVGYPEHPKPQSLAHETMRFHPLGGLAASRPPVSLTPPPSVEPAGPHRQFATPGVPTLASLAPARPSSRHHHQRTRVPADSGRPSIHQTRSPVIPVEVDPKMVGGDTGSRLG